MNYELISLLALCNASLIYGTTDSTIELIDHMKTALAEKVIDKIASDLVS